MTKAVPRWPLAVALLNLTGLSLGYLYMKRWLRWLIHLLLTAGLVATAFWTNPARLRLLWMIVFGLWLLWMVFDGWRQARRSVQAAPGRQVGRPLLPIFLSLLLVALEVTGFWVYTSLGQQEFTAGMTAYQLNDCRTALPYFSRVITFYELTLSPYVVAADVHLAECGLLIFADDTRRQADYASATMGYQAFLDRYPASVLAPLAQDTLAATYAEWAASLREARDYQAALDKYRIMLDRYPDTPTGEEAAASLAETYAEWAARLRESGAYEEAIAKYRIILDEYPATPLGDKAEGLAAEVYGAWASQLQGEGKYEEAIEKYQIVLDEYPHTSFGRESTALAAETYGKWAAHLRQMSAYEESIETYRIILNEYTDTPTGQEAAELAAEVYVAWALQLRATEDYATAVEKYQAALSEYPDTPAAVKAPEMIAATYAAWAAQLREAGRLLNAAEKYELILHQYPDTPLGEQAATLAAETYGEWAAYLREVGKYQKAVETYQLIFQRYPDTPAASGVEVAVAELYEMARQAMADDQACAPVSVLDAFIRADFMLANEAAATMPEALYSCGLADYAAGDYQGAIARYQALIEDYPASPLVDEAQAAVVDARVADIRASGTGELPPPQVVGRAPSGTTVVVVSNDSPERLEILLSGPSSKSLVVERCPTCQKYLGVGPVYCPEAGPQVRISLQPGQYEVVVRAIDDPDITPWSGSWELGDGEEFFNCFFIVTTFG